MIICKNMRTAIIAFTGLAIGIIIATGSPSTSDSNKIVLSFTQPETEINGIITELTKDYIIVSIKGDTKRHSVRFKLTENTLAYKVKFGKEVPNNETGRRELISINEIHKGDKMALTYIENNGELLATTIMTRW